MKTKLTDLTLSEKNKMIAEFIKEIKGVGLVNKYPYTPDKLKFHTSWDWLMPVVEKIEAMGNNIQIFYLHQLGTHACHIAKADDIVKPFENSQWAGNNVFTKIEAVYIAVIEFINWYNTHRL